MSLSSFVVTSVAPLQRAGVLANRELEVRACFRRRLDVQCRRVVMRILRAIPVDDETINAAADGIGHLGVDHGRISFIAKADADVTGTAPPRHVVGKYFRGSTGIKQRVNVNFTDVSRHDIAVGGALEAAGEIGVISGFLGKRGGGLKCRGAECRNRDKQCPAESENLAHVILPSLRPTSPKARGDSGHCWRRVESAAACGRIRATYFK